MKAVPSTPSRILYVKAPYLRQLRKKLTHYAIRVEDLVQYKNTIIYLRDGHRTVPVFVKDVVRVPIVKVPWLVMDSLGYKSRSQLEGNLREMTKLEEINEVTIMDLIVQDFIPT